MYCEWYDVCDFVVLSVVEVCVDYDGVNLTNTILDKNTRPSQLCCS